jgi:RNA polymerase sigma-70 factor (ECF subfamily)
VSKIDTIESCVLALRRYASAVVEDEREQEDLVHDCLVLALDRWHTYRGEGSPRAWLLAIMRNRFISRLRRQKVRAHANLFDLKGQDPRELPPTQELRTELRETLRALHALPDEQRQILVLIALTDFSYADVAQLLSIPIGTVMSRIYRGRERLRRMVEQPI